MDKVLSIASYQFLPPLMGGQKGIAFFNRYLSREVELIVATIPGNVDAGDEEAYELLPILGSGILRYVNPRLFLKIRKIIRARAATHLLLEHPYFGWLGVWLKRVLKIPLVVHSHNIEALRFKSFNKWWWPVMWHYERWVYKNADFTFFISEEDRRYAFEKMKIDSEKSTVITYGILQDKAPSQPEKAEAKKAVSAIHGLPPGQLLFLYSATLYYGPNLEGLDSILEVINPILQKAGITYQIIICGSHLPESYNKLDAYQQQNILYAGFVEDIDLYFRAADIFFNPISEGGGIKTKLVEALAGNCVAVSFKSGAFGVAESVTGEKLKIVPDKDGRAFAEAVLNTLPQIQKDIPASFFEHFYWGNIAAKAARVFGKLRCK